MQVVMQVLYHFPILFSLVCTISSSFSAITMNKMAKGQKNELEKAYFLGLSVSVLGVTHYNNASYSK